MEKHFDKNICLFNINWAQMVEIEAFVFVSGNAFASPLTNKNKTNSWKRSELLDQLFGQKHCDDISKVYKNHQIHSTSRSSKKLLEQLT